MHATRRTFLVLAGSVGAALATTGCDGEAPDAPATATPTTSAGQPLPDEDATALRRLRHRRRALEGLALAPGIPDLDDELAARYSASLMTHVFP
jgi:hypothetical protein